MKKSSPLITILTVTYNAVSTIEQTLLSALKQNFKDFEYVLVDGGSNDGTVEVVKKYESVFLDNGLVLRWISELDSGIFDAINKGLDIATAEYLIIIGSDDVFSSDTVLEEFADFKKTENAVVYGDVYMLGDHKLYDGIFSKMKLALRNPSHQAIFYPKIAYKKHKYILEYKYASDYEYNIRLWGAGLVFQRIDLTVIDFNQTGLGTLNEDRLFLKHKPKIVLKNFGFLCWLIVILQKIKIAVLGKKIVLNVFR